MTGRGPFRLGLGRAHPPTFLRIYLLVGSVALAVALLLYFHSLARRLDEQTETMGGLVARVIAFTALTVEITPDSAIEQQFHGIIRSLPFPVIVTHVSGLPLTWNARVGVPNLSTDDLLGEDLEHPSPVLARLLRIQDRMDRHHAPLAMTQPATDDTLMYLHYGSPSLAGELRWIPWLTIAVAGLFGLVALFIIRSVKRAEESFIWAGLAKETAHQMGTPLSSLIGWVEVLRDETARAEDATVPRRVLDEVLAEVEQDTQRLHRVAARFSQIGSRPKLQPAPVEPVVASTVDYLRRRLPEGVSLELAAEPGLPDVLVNAELLGWVIENLVKNAINAVDAPAGRIDVRIVADPGGGVEIRVRDNGRGVRPGLEDRIFRPGVSTRPRGWGMGLPLARRIVEQYHGGRLDLAGSEPGVGTTFRVALPPARGTWNRGESGG